MNTILAILFTPSILTGLVIMIGQFIAAHSESSNL